MQQQSAVNNLWSKFVIRLSKANPFFACIAMFSKFVVDDGIEVAQTIGREVRVNPGFILDLSDDEAYSYLLHQVMHLALQHDKRRLTRDAEVWNLAADIVINHIIRQSTSWPVAPRTAWDDRFTKHSVEQVYKELLREAEETLPQTQAPDSKHESPHEQPVDSGLQAAAQHRANQQAPSQDTSMDSSDGISSDSTSQSLVDNSCLRFYSAHNDLETAAESGTERDLKAEAAYWDGAVVQANVAAAANKNQGVLPGALKREFECLQLSRVDWRKELWRFVSRRQSDFSEFDQRHIHRGQYLEELSVDSLAMVVAIDTSGSITPKQLGIFMRELAEIQQLHADVQIRLYYCDADVIGPYDLSAQQRVAPTGGGGTSFIPLFDAVADLSLIEQPDCLVYFTDGYGDFPGKAPAYPTLWLLVDDGIPVSDVPWGTAVCIPDSGANRPPNPFGFGGCG